MLGPVAFMTLTHAITSPTVRHHLVKPEGETELPSAPVGLPEAIPPVTTKGPFRLLPEQPSVFVAHRIRIWLRALVTLVGFPYPRGTCVEYCKVLRGGSRLYSPRQRRACAHAGSKK